MVAVSWNDGMKFCEWLSKKEMKTCELLNEAQWEYAFRAGTQSAYSFGDDPQDLGDYGWYSDNSGRHTNTVGGKRPNPWGLYDMQGNVWEWCQDYYDAYSDAEVKNSIKVLKGYYDARMLRGGSWLGDAVYCRAASRRGFVPGCRYDDGGLRVCFRLD